MAAQQKKSESDVDTSCNCANEDKWWMWCSTSGDRSEMARALTEPKYVAGWLCCAYCFWFTILRMERTCTYECHSKDCWRWANHLTRRACMRQAVKRHGHHSRSHAIKKPLKMLLTFPFFTDGASYLPRQITSTRSLHVKLLSLASTNSWFSEQKRCPSLCLHAVWSLQDVRKQKSSAHHNFSETSKLRFPSPHMHSKMWTNRTLATLLDAPLQTLLMFQCCQKLSCSLQRWNAQKRLWSSWCCHPPNFARQIPPCCPITKCQMNFIAQTRLSHSPFGTAHAKKTIQSRVVSPTCRDRKMFHVRHSYGILHEPHHQPLTLCFSSFQNGLQWPTTRYSSTERNTLNAHIHTWMWSCLSLPLLQPRGTCTNNVVLFHMMLFHEVTPSLMFCWHTWSQILVKIFVVQSGNSSSSTRPSQLYDADVIHAFTSTAPSVCAVQQSFHNCCQT